MLGADILIILLLILINGFFVGAEIAFVSVRRTRLDELAEAGDRRAKRALRLIRDPGRFLAVIQVAITFLGALASAVAAVSIVAVVAEPLRGVPFLAPQADTIALLLVTLLVSIVSIVLGATRRSTSCRPTPTGSRPKARRRSRTTWNRRRPAWSATSTRPSRRRERAVPSVRKCGPSGAIRRCSRSCCRSPRG